jgi:8-oxo-dGTP pyrophosphatase MutT (NUDIX family)
MRTNTAPSHPAPAGSTGIQYGALPYRVTGHGLEILLITTRRTKRWIVPKGWPIEGLTPAKSAAREALEEAGISGEINAIPLGRFHYVKEFRQRVAVPCRVEVFALKVTRQRKNWDEKDARELKWVSVAEAVQMVEESGLRKLLHKFAGQVAANTHS